MHRSPPWTRSLCAALAICACQSYPFELRPPKRSAARRIAEIVTNPVPVDILFVIDNSGSMIDEMAALRENLDGFVDMLLAGDNDFHIGIITPDVECNVPERDCHQFFRTSFACCDRVSNDAIPDCESRDMGEGKAPWTNCDGGRLRTPDSYTQATGLSYFARPADGAARETMVQAMQDTIDALGCQGSGLEAGLEAMHRAVSCASGLNVCPDQEVAARNAGFIRPTADLVIIFLTDEDDCSFINDREVYLRPSNPALLADQAAHLCQPAECYAYLGSQLDHDTDGLMNWADREAGTPAGRLFTCSGFDRMVNPPLPTDVNQFIDSLIRSKGGDIRRVRAAGILASVPDESLPLGYRASHCALDALEAPTDVCGCWTASPVGADYAENFFCALTDAEHGAKPKGVEFLECGGTTPSSRDGCAAMTGGRYVQMLETLAERRVTEGLVQPDTLVDSICRGDYHDTLFKIVNTVILTSCFDLGDQLPDSADDILVLLNGVPLQRVEPGTADTAGWSWTPGRRTVCLEGGLVKVYGDRFDIVVLQPAVVSAP